MNGKITLEFDDGSVEEIEIDSTELPGPETLKEYRAYVENMLGIDIAKLFDNP